MRSGHVDRLSSQHVNRFRIICRHRVMRQMWVKIEGCDPGEPAAGVEVSVSGQWSNLLGSRSRRWMKPPAVFYRNTEPFHQRAPIAGKALLTWHQRISVMGVFHLPLAQVVGGADVVVWAHDQARSLAHQKLLDRLDLPRVGFLFHSQMVKTEYH